MKIKRFSFSIHILMCIVLSVLQIFILFKAPIIYIPLFFVIVISFYFGLLETKKGWILAIIQVIIIIAGYWIATYLGFRAQKPDEAVFAAHIMIFPSFVASFLAGFLFGK